MARPSTNNPRQMGSGSAVSGTIAPIAADNALGIAIQPRQTNNSAALTQSPAAAPGNSPDHSSEQEALYEVHHILGHVLHRSDQTVGLIVEWEDLCRTEEPEWRLQLDCPELVYDYWDRFRGGRYRTTGFTMYHVLAILDHVFVTQNGHRSREYLVQWVGYREELSTWEPADKMAEIAPVLKLEYDIRKEL